MHNDTSAPPPKIGVDVMRTGRQLQCAPTAFPHATFSLWLDFVRWVAALAVVFAHTNDFLLMRIVEAKSTQRTMPYYGFTFISGFAEQAVMVFFVLSGYLVGGGLLREARNGGAVNVTHYLVKRVSRLCIVLYPAFLLIAALNMIGVVAFHGVDTGMYPPDIFARLRPSTLVCNASFLQTVACDQYGDDGALWSLCNEFWYYVVWPLILLAFLKGAAWKRIVFFAAACSILAVLTKFQFMGAAIGPYMLVWLLGVVVALMRRPVIKSPVVSWGLFIAGLLVVRFAVRRDFSSLHHFGQFLLDVAIGVLFANLLITLKHCRALGAPIGREWNSRFAGFSFSLYCIHISILHGYAAGLMYLTGTNSKMIPDRLWKWGVVVAAIGTSLFVAYLFSLVTERHTTELRTWLTRMFKRGEAGGNAVRSSLRT